MIYSYLKYIDPTDKCDPSDLAGRSEAQVDCSDRCLAMLSEKPADDFIIIRDCHKRMFGQSVSFSDHYRCETFDDEPEISKRSRSKAGSLFKQFWGKLKDDDNNINMVYCDNIDNCNTQTYPVSPCPVRTCMNNKDIRILCRISLKLCYHHYIQSIKLIFGLHLCSGLDSCLNYTLVYAWLQAW